MTKPLTRQFQRAVRLHVLKAATGPALWDFELYEAQQSPAAPASPGIVTEH